MLGDNDGGMRPCGCQRGRPCTCDMGKKAQYEFTACGECVNCLLNAKSSKSKRRKCLKGADDPNYDRVVLAPNCIFWMRKPDWEYAHLELD